MASGDLSGLPHFVGHTLTTPEDGALACWPREGTPMRCQSCGNEHHPAGAKFCLECAAPLTAEPERPGAPTSLASDRYQLRELLGEGARKRVYAGTDTRLGREVAVAVIKTEDLDTAGRQRLEREVRAEGAFDHGREVSLKGGTHTLFAALWRVG